MSDKNITLEYYPKTVTEIILNGDTAHPKIIVETTRDTGSTTRFSSGTTSPHRTISNKSAESLSPFLDSSRSLDELPSLFGAIKMQGYQRKQLRVFFDSNVIESPRQPVVSRVKRLSVPSHVVSLKKPTSQIETERRRSTKLSACLPKKENSTRIHRLCQEWKLKCAIKSEKEDVHLNQRKVQESTLWRQKASSFAVKSQRIQETRNAVKILIVGAGLSGLSAANRLLSYNFKNVTILEALDRIGGRIHSVTNDENPSCVMELGAPGIHHLETWNTVFNLASRNNLTGEAHCQTRASDVHLFPLMNAHVFKKNKRKAIQYACALEDLNGVIKEMNRNTQNSAINLSYKDYVREQTRRLCKSMTGRGIDDSEISDLTYQMSCFMQEALYRSGDSKGAAAVHHLDANARTAIWLMRLPRGMSSLFVPLMKQFKEDTIQFHSHVKEIDLSLCNPSKMCRGSDPLIKVTCENGRVYTAHHVIVTLPLGYLKQHARNMFHPRLTKSKLQAIENLGFGTVSKVFLHYSEPFWSHSLNFIWSDDVGDDYDLCRRDTLTFTAEVDDTVIQVVTVGTYLEDVCDSYLKRLLTSVLTSCLHLKVPDPEKITRSFWSTSPVFGGTHPFMSQASSTEDVDELAAPIYANDTPIVLFAGDATYKSYTCLTHAARASGLREAVRIENFYDELQKHENTN